MNQVSPDLQDSKETEDLRVCLALLVRPAPLWPQSLDPLVRLVSLESEDRRESPVSQASLCLDLQDDQDPLEPRVSPVFPVPQASPPDRTASQENQGAPGCRARGGTPERPDRKVKRATPALTALEVARVYQDSPDLQDLQDSQVLQVDQDSKEREVTQAAPEDSELLAPWDPQVLPVTQERRATPVRP